MRVIDPEGLFGGDRFDDVSDQARYVWPYLWCASNGYGRLELHFHKVIGRVFARFRKPPTEAEFFALISEYQDAFLLYVYEASGQLWGQFNTSEQYLPRHKRAEDERSPKPNFEDFARWQESYIERKRAKSSGSNNRVNLARILPKLRGGISAGSPLVVERIGVVEESIGSGKTLLSNSAKPAPKLDVIATWFESEFWPIYWRRDAKKAGLKAARLYAKTPEARTKIIAAVKEQRTEMMSREKQHRSLPSSWLSGERWTDEINSTVSPVPVSRKLSVMEQIIQETQE